MRRRELEETGVEHLKKFKGIQQDIKNYDNSMKVHHQEYSNPDELL